MIPHGRTAIDRAGVARIYGRALGTLSNTTPHLAEGFPERLNPEASRNWLWDEEQVQAHRDGRPIPPLPQDPHPEDLLDDKEAAAYAGLRFSTWRAYISEGRIEATPVNVCGVRHWKRGTIRRRHDTPPGKRGRPHGATDATPRPRRRRTENG
jgi:hypothetical protein